MMYWYCRVIFFAPVGAIAAENPDKRIILVDTEPTDSAGNPVEAENIYSMTFAEQEGGFLPGGFLLPLNQRATR